MANQYDVYGAQRQDVAEFGRQRRGTLSVGAKIAGINKKMKEEERKLRERQRLIKEVTNVGINVAQNVREMKDIRRGAGYLGAEMPESGMLGNIGNYLFGPSSTQQVPVGLQQMQEGMVGPPAPSRYATTGQLSTLGRLSESAPQLAESVRNLFMGGF